MNDPAVEAPHFSSEPFGSEESQHLETFLRFVMSPDQEARKSHEQSGCTHEVPEPLHHVFKSMATRQRSSMTGVLAQYASAYVHLSGQASFLDPAEGFPPVLVPPSFDGADPFSVPEGQALRGSAKRGRRSR